MLRDIYENCSFAFSITDRCSYAEAASQEVWLLAMEEEIKSIQRNNTWDLVDLPEGKTPVGLKWIYKAKYNANGSV